MAAKKKGKNKAVKKAAGRKPVAKKKKQPVADQGLETSSGTTFGTAVVTQAETSTQLPAELVEQPAKEDIASVATGQSDGGIGLKMFKAEAADGDTIYVQAPDLDQAKNKFDAIHGEIPETLVTWSEVESLPEGEELMAEPHTLDEEDHTAGSGMEPEDDDDDFDEDDEG